MIVVPKRKRKEIVTSIQVCLISRMSINYKEKGGKKCFYLQIQSINTVHPNVEKKKNGEYYEYPSLSLFMDEL